MERNTTVQCNEGAQAYVYGRNDCHNCGDRYTISNKKQVRFSDEARLSDKSPQDRFEPLFLQNPRDTGISVCSNEKADTGGSTSEQCPQITERCSQDRHSPSDEASNTYGRFKGEECAGQFTTEKSPRDTYDPLHHQKQRNTYEVCFCCKEGDCADRSRDVGRPVLVYELPEPKFDDLTISKRDFVAKPLPKREMPPWHPIRKDQWRSLNGPSLNKSTYQRDFTPPINMPHEKQEKAGVSQCTYLTEEDKKTFTDEKKDTYQEEAESFKLWRKTSEGPNEIIEVCDNPSLQIQETKVPSRHKEPAISHTEEAEDPIELHGPECEKHCYSTPLMCHVKPEMMSRNHTVSTAAMPAALSIEMKHLHHGDKKVRFAPEVCHVEALPDDGTHCEGGRRDHEDPAFSSTREQNSRIEKNIDRNTYANYGKMSDSQKARHCPEDQVGHFNGARRGSSDPVYSGISQRVHFQDNNNHSCGQVCSKDNQVHYPDSGSHGQTAFPLYPGTSPAVHFHRDNSNLPNCGYECSTKQKEHQSDSGGGYNANETPKCPETSNKGRIEEDNGHSQNYVAGSSDGGRHRQDERRVNLGYSGGEGHGCSATPRCTDTYPPPEYIIHLSNYAKLNPSSNQIHHGDTSSRNDKNGLPTQDFKYHCSQGSEGLNPRECTHSSKFTYCKDTKPPNLKWWKMGCSDPIKREKSFEIEDVPQQLKSPYCPPYLSMTRHDFQQPIIDGRREYSMMKRATSNDCGCTEKEDATDFTKFQKGGLI